MSGIEITFLGAAGTVTGSRHLVDVAGRRLLVDCGMFQGVRELRRRNWDAFPVAPNSIDAVLLTHAHIDHVGWLPALVRDGFRGPIWCTPATADLVRILLPDAAHIQEEDARFANRHRTSRHDPALPLYTADDASRVLDLLRPHESGRSFEPEPGIGAQFSPVGHILGAASIRISDGSRSVLITGDVGRPVDPIMLPPASPLAADHVVTESTYGDRTHPSRDSIDDLADIIERTARRGGTVLVPVFAVGRAQTVLHLVAQLRDQGSIPDMPVFLDSPMAVNTTELFCRHPHEHRLSDLECTRMCDGVGFIRTVDESKRLAMVRGPVILLAASGMLTGGRVLHHLERLAGDRHHTVVLVGYQAAGTRGEALARGARSIKMFGEQVQIRCEITRIDGLSAHADGTELTRWLSKMPIPRLGASVVHGEPDAAAALAGRLRDELGWHARIPTHGDTIELA